MSTNFGYQHKPFRIREYPSREYVFIIRRKRGWKFTLSDYRRIQRFVDYSVQKLMEVNK